MIDQSVQIGKNIISIGRDFKGNIINSNPNELFYSTKVAAYSKTYIPPDFVTRLFQELQREKIVILGGEYGFDKVALLRYLAASLEQKFKVNVLEWTGKTENQSIVSALKGVKSGIYIIPKLQPNFLNYDIGILEKMVRNKPLFLLLSSDTPESAWYLPKVVSRKYWFEIKAEKISYSQELLLSELVSRMNERIDSIQFENGVAKIDHSTLIPGGTIKQLAQNFSNPEQIHYFIDLLSRINKVIDLSVIKDCVKKAISVNETFIAQWFHSLNDLEQLTALSLALFSGLLDDQYFAAIKRLSNSGWKHSHEGLKSLDYINVERLLYFFKYDKLNDEEKIIRSKYTNQRIEILSIVWNSHRRHIKEALAMVVSMVNDSCTRRHQSTELFGTKQRVRIIQSVASDLLSDIGLISINLIEESLLTLASQDTFGAQSVAAGALAQWREVSKGDSRLFNLLDNWQKESNALVMIEGFITDRKQASSPYAYLRSTIILTIGYSTKYDPPNQLSLELIELLFSFLSDRNPLVRSRLQQTIPGVLRYHLSQFSQEVQVENQSFVPLKELLKHNDLIYPVSIGLALADIDSPEKTRKIILSCIKYCIDNTQKSKKYEFSERDKLLTAMILAIGKIAEWNGLNQTIGGKTAEVIIKDLRENEKNSNIKAVLFHVILDQVVIKNKNHQLIRLLIPELSELERDLIVSALGDRYIEERSEIIGGESTLQYDSKEFDIWVDTERPVIFIEKLMYEWIVDDSKELRQIGTLAFIKFAEIFEKMESEFIAKIIEERRKANEREKRESDKNHSTSAIIKGKFSVKTGIQKSYYKFSKSTGAFKIIDAAFPIISKGRQIDQELTQVVLDKWKNSNVANKEIKEAAKALEKIF